MTVLFDPIVAGDVVKWEENRNYSREVITLQGGAVYAMGSVLGVVGASGRYALSPAAVTAGLEGAETATAVLIERIDATAGDQPAVALTRGPSIVSRDALVFDASVDQPAEKAAKYAQLTAAGIVPRITA